MYRKIAILSRFVPWPSDTGAFLYSALLGGLVSEFAFETVLVAAENPFGSQPPPDGIRIVAEAARNWPMSKSTSPAWALRYLASGLPFASQPFRTRALRSHARDALEGADLVVLDHIGASWALDLALTARVAGARLVYIAHNVESDTRRTAINAGDLRAAFARFDARRIEVAERRLLRDAHAVVCISSGDRDRFREIGARADLVVVNPIHSGPATLVRLDVDTPRRVVIVGSFHWRAKQHNLMRFLTVRSAAASTSDIAVRIVGSMPAPFQRKLAERFPDVEITGRVDRIQDHLDGCRIGVIPEEEGGGFKLKALDYAYAGLPIFGLDKGLRGLPLRDGASMRAFTTMEGLWTGILAWIDALPDLDGLRQNAFLAFESSANIEHLRSTLTRVLRTQV